MGIGTEGFTRRQPDVFKIRANQGALGHPRPKPTTLMTNMAQLRELDGIKAPAAGEEIQEDLQERLRQTAPWPSLAAGLVGSLKMVIPRFLQEQNRQPVLQKLDREGWKNHLLSQHVPYRRPETMGCKKVFFGCFCDVSRHLWAFQAGNRLGSIQAQEGEARTDRDHPCAKMAGSRGAAGS